MAVSTTALSAYEQARYDADSACVLPVNLLAVNTVSTARWTVGGKSTDTSYTITSLNKPGFRAYDNIGDLTTMMSGITAATVYFNLKMGAALPNFDTVVVYGHNFFLSGPKSVSASNSDVTHVHLEGSSDDFVSDTVILQTHAVTSDDLKANIRIVFNDFAGSGSGPHVAQNVTELRLRVVAGGTQTVVWYPSLGEIFVGSRRGFKASPSLPWAPYGDGAASNFTDFISQSGAQSRYVFSKGQARREFKQTLNAYTGFDDDLNLWRDWYRLSDHGTNPFVYLHKQESAPTENWLMSNEAANLNAPLTGFNLHDGAMSWLELPPFAMPERKPLDDS